MCTMSAPQLAGTLFLELTGGLQFLYLRLVSCTGCICREESMSVTLKMQKYWESIGDSSSSLVLSCLDHENLHACSLWPHAEQGRVVPRLRFVHDIYMCLGQKEATRKKEKAPIFRMWALFLQIDTPISTQLRSLPALFTTIISANSIIPFFTPYVNRHFKAGTRV